MSKLLDGALLGLSVTSLGLPGSVGAAPLLDGGSVLCNSGRVTLLGRSGTSSDFPGSVCTLPVLFVRRKSVSRSSGRASATLSGSSVTSSDVPVSIGGFPQRFRAS